MKIQRTASLWWLEHLNRSVLRERVLLDGMEKRGEPRRDGRIVVTVTGRDKIRQPFAQEAIATSVSESRGLLSGITRHVRPGDLLWVEHRGKRSRFKVVWVRDSESQQLIQAAVHRVDTEPCPWAKL
jgi:hypothetical protein